MMLRKNDVKMKRHQRVHNDYIEWVKYQNKLRKEGLFRASGRVRARFKRVRDHCKEDLRFLTEMAKLLPEDQRAQVFNAETLKSFFEAIFNPKLIEPGPDKRVLDAKEYAIWRDRTASLLEETLNIIARKELIQHFVPYEIYILAGNEFLPPVNHLKTLYYSLFFKERKKKQRKTVFEAKISRTGRV